MHEGFVNYNAGTLGASMVEGRITAGVVVGDGSDVGGGASIMGTLSGGGTAGRLDRRALPARGQRRASASRSATTASSRRAATSPPGTKVTMPDGRGRQGAGPRPAATTCSSAATRSPAPSRSCRGGPAGSPSTRRCTRTDRARRMGAAGGSPPSSYRSAGGRRRRRTASRAPAPSSPTSTIGECTTDGRRAEGDPQRRAGAQRQPDRGDRRPPRACRPTPRRSRWPRRCRSPSSTTCAAATATRSGLFQQRPSQGWGTPRQILDPVLRHQRVLRRPGAGAGLRDDAGDRGRAAGAALGLPVGVRRLRGATRGRWRRP